MKKYMIQKENYFGYLAVGAINPITDIASTLSETNYDYSSIREEDQRSYMISLNDDLYRVKKDDTFHKKYNLDMLIVMGIGKDPITIEETSNIILNQLNSFRIDKEILFPEIFPEYISRLENILECKIKNNKSNVLEYVSKN